MDKQGSQDLDRIVRRNAGVLMAANAVNGSILPIAVTLGGLAGVYLLGPDKSLATLPVTASTVGSALTTIPAAILMSRIGRRKGFVIGAAPAILGGLLATFALMQGLFWLFAVALFFIGMSGAFNQQYRFAAIDAGSPAVRTKAMSLVMAGGIFSGIIGPQTVILTNDWLSPVIFAGSFLAAAGLGCIGLLIASGIRDVVPPRELRSHADGPKGRPLRVIARQPRFIAAVLCGISAYALMSLVMTAAPLAMVGCGLTQSDAALGIQWHVLAMFGPSFFTGRLIVRFGKDRVVIAGLALLTACAVVGMSGISLAHFWITLILLGLGWNLGFIGATAMLADTYRPEERGRVQGLNDFLVLGAAAIASLLSGKLIGGPGWVFINLIVFPVVTLSLAALAGSVLLQRRAAQEKT
ncbi:MFS transporter [Kaistia sp. 32K]|uniref:MFS transporter n=1 Tax=Kaistia sp. 32K TaxID=2795690 RepID=UPI00191643AA|nr:MFS transporter [Kaistia sp. 32K]BCP53358.1 MFS transporter [Kaistia sp. 32K]